MDTYKKEENKMNAYKTRIVEKIAEATYAREYCQQKAWEYVGMREDSTTAKDYFESVKRWDEDIEKMMKRAKEEKITKTEIKNAIDKYYKAMQEDE